MLSSLIVFFFSFWQVPILLCWCETMGHRPLPLCALLGVLLAGLFANLQAQDGKLI